MANKSFTIQYIIKARDRYTVAANKVRRASRNMRVSIEKTKRSFVASSAAMAKSGLKLTLAVTTPIVLAARSIKNAARDAEETRSKFRTVFNSMGPEAEAAADKLAKSYGLAGTTSRKLIGDTADVLTGFGFTQKESLKLSTRVNQMAVDLASFTNVQGGTDRASNAITKALLGEAESMKLLGVVINQTDPGYKRLVKNFVTVEGKSLKQAKALTAMAMIVAQSKNAIGDFARTQHELANQERITAQKTIEMKEAFGRVLMPAALLLTKTIKRLVLALTDLSPQTKKIILIFAAVLAIGGPLLVALGGIALVLPLIKAGFLSVGIAALPALMPVLAIAAAVAAVAFLIKRNWGSLKGFFSGFSTGLGGSMSGMLDRISSGWTALAKLVGGLFGKDSDAAKSLMEFTNIGELIGTIVGGVLDKIVKGFLVLGTALGQLVAAAVSFDFSKFDIKAILSAGDVSPDKPGIINANQRVDVGVNVGLDSGLKQTTPFNVTTAGTGRSDVGLVTP